MTIFSFPMDQIGLLLRNLSLSGAIGNVIAIILYAAISLIPAFGYLYLRAKKKNLKADVFLLFISIYSFIMMYFMINPGLFPSVIPEGGKMMLGSTFYSLLCTYFVLRILSTWKKADIPELQKGIRNFLYVLIVIFVLVLVFECGVGTVERIQTVKASNSGVDFMGLYEASSLIPTYLFVILQGIVKAVPYIFDIVITIIAMKAIRLLSTNGNMEEAMGAVEKLTRVCTNALGISVVTSLGFNILQLLFQSMLYNVNFSVELPIFSLVFVLAVLLFARYMQEYQKMKQEHDLFI